MGGGRFTLGRFSFADAFELFVLLSGWACGMTFSRLMESQGWFASFRKSLSRVVRLYATHVALVLSSLCILGFTTATVGRILRVFTFQQDTNFTILPLYVLLALFTPLIVHAWQHHRYALMAFSALTYLAGQSLSVPGYGLNPLCAQAVFILGMAIGIEYRQGTLWRPGRSLFRAACAGLVLVAVARILQSDRLTLVLGQPIFHNLSYPFCGKGNTGLLRVVNVVWWLIVVPRFVNAANLQRFQIARWIAQAGMSPLAVYSTSVLLSVFLPVSAVQLLPAYLSGLIWDLGGVALMLGVGAFLYQSRRRGRAQDYPPKEVAFSCPR